MAMSSFPYVRQHLEICYFFDPERPQQPFSIVSAGSRCKNALAMHTSGVFYFKYIYMYIQSVSICFVQACTSSTIPFCIAEVGGGEASAIKHEARI